MGGICLLLLFSPEVIKTPVLLIFDLTITDLFIFLVVIEYWLRINILNCIFTYGCRKCCFSKIIIQDEISQCSCSTMENMYEVNGLLNTQCSWPSKYYLNVRENGANGHTKVGLP